MATLHTVNQSPLMGSALASCVRLSREGSGILLLEDAVLACIASGESAELLREVMDSREVFVLEEDLAARGVSPARVLQEISVVDYAGFVDLCTRYGKVQAWF